MTAKTKAQPKAKVQRPSMGYPEQFRFDCLKLALQLPTQDAKTALAAAREMAEFVLGANVNAVTR